MYFPPVLQRELAVAARRKSTAWGRSLSAGIAFVVLLVLLIGTRGNSGSSGPLLLRFISLFVLLECLLAGARYTADCLSEEKREGTLGLLFLTPLTALEVVLGKLLARSLGAIYNLLAILPVFALSFLIGGVTGAQVFSTSVLLLVTVIFSLAAGLFVSSMGKNNHAVLMGAVALVAGFALLPPTFWKGLSSVFGYLEFWDILLYLSPAFGYNQALRGWRPEVANTCWTLLALSALFISASAWRLRGSVQESDTLGSVNKSPAVLSSRPKPLLRQILHENPMLWLTLRSRRRFTLALGLAALFLAFGAFSRVVLEMERSLRMLIPVVIFGSYGLHALYKFLIAADSCRQLNEDKRSGALELLLSTPFQPRWIVRGQLRATRKIWVPTAIALGLMNLIWMTNPGFMRDIPIFLPCSIFLIVVDSYALCWRGVVNALRSERYISVVFRSWFQVTGPPLAILLLIFFTHMNGLSNTQAQSILLFWTIGCTVYDLLLIRASRAQLLHFRSLAAGERLFRHQCIRRIHAPGSPPTALRAEVLVSN